MSRAAVKNEPLSAPKQEIATMTENIIPPIAPKITRPKSRATVFERSTVDSRRTFRHPDREGWGRYSPCLGRGNRIHWQVKIETWNHCQYFLLFEWTLKRTVVIPILEWMTRGRFLSTFFISPTMKLAERSVESEDLRNGNNRYYTLVPAVICPESRE